MIDLANEPTLLPGRDTLLTEGRVLELTADCSEVSDVPADMGGEAAAAAASHGGAAGADLCLCLVDTVERDRLMDDFVLAFILASKLDDENLAATDEEPSEELDADPDDESSTDDDPLDSTDVTPV